MNGCHVSFCPVSSANGPDELRFMRNDSALASTHLIRSTLSFTLVCGSASVSGRLCGCRRRCRSLIHVSAANTCVHLFALPPLAPSLLTLFQARPADANSSVRPATKINTAVPVRETKSRGDVSHAAMLVCKLIFPNFTFPPGLQCSCSYTRLV